MTVSYTHLERLLAAKKNYLSFLQNKRQLTERQKILKANYVSCLNEKARSVEEKQFVARGKEQIEPLEMCIRDSASATTPKTDIDGSLNVKYNLDSRNSLLLGFGVRWVAPFTAGGPTNYSGTQYDAINPTITYQHIYKYVGIQAVLQVAAMEYTPVSYTHLDVYKRQA